MYKSWEIPTEQINQRPYTVPPIKLQQKYLKVKTFNLRQRKNENEIKHIIQIANTISSGYGKADMNTNGQKIK